MSKVWNTEFGPRRVREEPPSIEEALFAASGLSDDPQERAEIAAALMGVSVEEAKAAMRRARASTVTLTRRSGAPRAVVVERRPTRRSARHAG